MAPRHGGGRATLGQGLDKEVRYYSQLKIPRAHFLGAPSCQVSSRPGPSERSTYPTAVSPLHLRQD